MTACARLRPHVRVEALSFESALTRARELLGCRSPLREEPRL